MTDMKDVRLLALGHKIRLERMKRDIAQEQLAEMAGVSVCTISDVERGISDIRYTNLFQIADALGLKLSELLDFKL